MAKLPTVTSNVSPDLRAFLDRVREAINGTGADSLVSVRQLVAAGVVAHTGTGITGTGGTGPVSPPIRPENVGAAGALANIMVTWDKPIYAGHAYAEIWSAARSTEQAAATPPENPILGQAELVGMAPGVFFAHNLGAGATRFYWVRFVNVLGEVGPYHATDGVYGQTSQNPAYLMDVLTETYGSGSESPFFQLDAATTIGGVSIPAGTYMKTAFVVDASITRAKIADAAIDNAKIANLNAGKIDAGFLDAARIEAGSIDANMIDSRGLSIKDAAGNIILAAGTPLGVSNVSGLGTLATADDITMSSVTDAGGFATLDTITAANVSTYIASAAIDVAQIKTASITNLSSLAVDAGTLTAGVLKSSDNKFVIDLNAKTISIET